MRTRLEDDMHLLHGFARLGQPAARVHLVRVRVKIRIRVKGWG